MTAPDDSAAFPTYGPAIEKRIGGETAEILYGLRGGLSKRELFAALILAGWASAKLATYPDITQASRSAVDVADALLAALERKP